MEDRDNIPAIKEGREEVGEGEGAGGGGGSLPVLLPRWMRRHYLECLKAASAPA